MSSIEMPSNTMEMPRKRNLWSLGFMAFAAFMMIMIGTFQALSGLVAIFEDEFFVVTQDYLYKFDVTTWGWIHLAVGLLIVAAGIGLLFGATWARIIAIIVAVISAAWNFAYIPYYPAWSITIIALNVAVIWVLTVHGTDFAAE